MNYIIENKPSVTGDEYPDNYTGLSEAERANVSFDIADPGYDFEGDDVKKLVSLLKPETWKKEL